MKKQVKKIQKLLSICLILTFMLSGMNVLAAKKSYQDIKDHKYEEALNYAVKNKLLTSSTKKIKADSNITKGAVLKAVNTLLGANTPYENMDEIKNLKQGDDYYKTMSYAVKAGYEPVLANKKMNPKQKVSRNYVADILSDVLGVEKTEILGSTDDVFAKMTRGEFAYILLKYAPNIVKKTGTAIGNGNVIINKPGVVLRNVAVSGNLIIGDGVGAGEVELQNVSISGKLLVRGGGENSIKINGGSIASEIIIRHVNQKVSVKVSNDSVVKIVYIEDGCNDVVIEGTVGTLKVIGDKVNVQTVNAKIGTIEMSGLEGKLNVAADSKVDNISVNSSAKAAGITIQGVVTKVQSAADGVNVTVEKNAIVGGLVSTGSKITVEGEGTLKSADVKGEENSIKTPGTNVTNGTTVTQTTPAPVAPSVPSGPSTPSNPSNPSNPGGEVTPTATPIPGVKDDRFDDQYPKMEINQEDGTLVVKVKLKEGIATKENPAYVYYVGTGNKSTMKEEESVENVIHGHFGKDYNNYNGNRVHDYVDASTLYAFKITDSAEVCSTPLYMYNNDGEGYRGCFVIKTKDRLSESVTEIRLECGTGKVYAPSIEYAGISSATAKDGKDSYDIFVYFASQLSEESIPDVSAFTVTGTAIDAKITSIAYSEDPNCFVMNYLMKLTMECPSGSNLDNLKILYNMPELNPLMGVSKKDESKVDNFDLQIPFNDYYYDVIDGVEYEIVQLMKTHTPEVIPDQCFVSEDGKYLSIDFTGCMKDIYRSAISDYVVSVNGEQWGEVSCSFDMDSDGTLECGLSLHNENAEPKESYKVEITNDSGTYMNELNEILPLPLVFDNIHPTIDVQIHDKAVYSRSQKTLSVNVIPADYEMCSYYLRIDGTEYRLRGKRVWYQSGVEFSYKLNFTEQNFIELTDLLDKASEVYFVYHPNNIDFGATSDSGQRLKEFEVKVDMED